MPWIRFSWLFSATAKVLFLLDAKRKKWGGEKRSTTGKIIEQQIYVRLNAIGLTLILYEFWAYDLEILFLLQKKIRNKIGDVIWIETHLKLEQTSSSLRLDFSV